jgi:hypothetical protein
MKKQKELVHIYGQGQTEQPAAVVKVDSARNEEYKALKLNVELL